MKEPTRHDPDASQGAGPLVIGGHDPGHYIAMPTEKLGGAVQGEGGSQLQGALQNRGGERRIDEHRDRSGLLDYGSDVHQFQCGIGRSLHDNQRRVRPDRLGHLRGLRPGDLQTQQATRQEMVSATVERANRHYMPSPLSRRHEARGDRGHPR